MSTYRAWLRRLSTFWICAVPLMTTAPLLAQSSGGEQYELVLRGVALADALEVLVQETNVDLVYSSDLVAGKEVYCVKRHADAEVLLRCVLDDAGIEYVRSRSGTYVLIPSVRQPPEWGTLAGAVVDEATGDPLPFANVFLAEAHTGTAANAAGLFTLAPLVSGPYRLTVTYVGYETVVDTIFVTSGGQRRVQVAMRARENHLSPVVIDGLEQRLPSYGLGAEAIAGAAVRELPIAPSPDVARAVASLTGVSMQRPLADLHLQGGSAGSHDVLLDGAPVRDPVSLGRHLGAFSPLALGRLRVHRAGYGAATGSNLTGVLAVEQDPSTSGQREFAVRVDPVALNARFSSRFSIGKVRGQGMVASRNSVWDVYRAPYVDALFRRWHEPDPLTSSLWLQQPVDATSLDITQQLPAVHFSDVHGAAVIEPAPYQQIGVSIYRARNHLASTLSALNTPFSGTGAGTFFATDDRYDWTNWASRLRHSWLAGARTIVTTQITGSSHESDYTYGAAQTTASAVDLTEPAVRSQTEAALRSEAGSSPIGYESHRIRESTLRSDIHYSLSAHKHVTLGASTSYLSSRVQLRSPFVTPFEHETDTWHLAGFLEGDFRIGYRTSVEPGVRITHVFSRGTAYLEPRLSLRHDRERTALGSLAIRLAGGLYRQFVNDLELTSAGSTSVVPFVFFWMPTGSTVGPPRAYHTAADILLMPSRQISLSLSLYYKWQPRLLVFDYPALVASEPPARDVPRIWLEQAEFTASASGRASGGELRFERRSDVLLIGGGYALSHVRRTIDGRFNGTSQPVPWNVPHELFMQGRLSVLPRTEVETAASLTSGRRWAFRDGYYNYLLERLPSTSFGTVQLDNPGAHRLPTSFALDLGVRYDLPVRSGDLQVRVMVLDALNNRNVYEHGLAARESSGLSPTARRIPGRSLLVSLNLRQ